MKKVYQTKFGGVDAPDEQKGDCWQAAIASILEIPLEESFDIVPFWDDDGWFDKFVRWLIPYGMSCVGYDVDESGRVGNLPPQGYHLIETESTTLKNGERHILVGCNGKVVHDPNPNATSVGKPMIWYVFTALDPAKVKR